MTKSGSHEESGFCGDRDESAALLDPFLYQTGGRVLV
jgi:hypothetical protein